jgi:hypothetical protein
MYLKIKQMKSNILKSKLSSLIALLCSLIILALYSMNLKSDYYFHFSKKEINAEIEQIIKVSGYKPYVITLGYLNEYTNKKEQCLLKLDGRFGSKISAQKLKNIEIFYTKQGPCDIYIKDYKFPRKGALIIHVIIFLISFLGGLIFAKKLFNKSPIQ